MRERGRRNYTLKERFRDIATSTMCGMLFGLDSKKPTVFKI